MVDNFLQSPLNVFSQKNIYIADYTKELCSETIADL